MKRLIGNDPSRMSPKLSVIMPPTSILIKQKGTIENHHSKDNYNTCTGEHRRKPPKHTIRQRQMYAQTCVSDSAEALY